MSYKVTCSDIGCQYGPFTDEGDAYKYAGLLDIDPACKDTEHEVEWTSGYSAVLPFDELRDAIRERIVKEATKNATE